MVQRFTECPSWRGNKDNQSLKQLLHSQPGKQRMLNATGFPASLYHVCSTGFRPGNGATHSGQVVPPQLTWDNQPQACSESSLPGDSRFYQLILTITVILPHPWHSSGKHAYTGGREGRKGQQRALQNFPPVQKKGKKGNCLMHLTPHRAMMSSPTNPLPKWETSAKKPA